MTDIYLPEGERFSTPENQILLTSRAGLEHAMSTGQIIEGIATVCDEKMRLHVDLGVMRGIVPPEEAVLCRAGEIRKDIAVVSRVGKPIAVKITEMAETHGELIARLSRRKAQQACQEHLLLHRIPGDLIPARVTHLEPFGAFMDIGCGLSSLLSIDCISVSRISHPRDRLSVGSLIPVVIKSIDKESGRIAVSLRELLGTWEENAAGFEVGQTVTGIVRSVENYGAFIELTPNLAGLSEIRNEEQAENMRALIGHTVAVFIKSINPERMKIKLVVVDTAPCRVSPKKLTFFIHPEQTPHLSRWQYSPAQCAKTVAVNFEAT